MLNRKSQANAKITQAFRELKVKFGKILQIIKSYKKDIIRIEFKIVEKETKKEVKKIENLIGQANSRMINILRQADASNEMELLDMDEDEVLIRDYKKQKNK